MHERYWGKLENLKNRSNDNFYYKLGYEEGLRQYYYDKGQIELLEELFKNYGCAKESENNINN